jgi:cell division protein FtsW (lipid II flippase)
MNLILNILSIGGLILFGIHFIVNIIGMFLFNDPETSKISSYGLSAMVTTCIAFVCLFHLFH